MSIGGATQWDEFKLFEREAKVLKQLNHPYIPRYLDYFQLNEPIKGSVLVQEYIEGQSFKDLILQEKRFTESQIKEIAKNILDILVYLHELNPPVLHRDIKPSNLIWGEDGHIYLIDFGAVQYRAAVEGSTFTVVGTYGYTPIEQFGGRAVAGSDIYALGTTLINLLTGIPPADLPQEDFKIQFANKVDLSPNLIRWLGKTIEPDIKKRFDTAKTALSALQSGTNHHENASTSLSKKLYYSKQVVPLETNVELQKTLDEFIIKSPCLKPNEMHFMVAVIHIIFGLFIPIIFGTPVVIILLLISFSLIIPLIPRGRNRLLFHYNMFDIYRHDKFIERGIISDIEEVKYSEDIHDYSIEKSYFVSIKTKEQKYVFGEGLTKAECIWLVEEIKSWLEQQEF